MEESYYFNVLSIAAGCQPFPADVLIVFYDGIMTYVRVYNVYALPIIMVCLWASAA
jgi:hypothetical protein